MINIPGDTGGSWRFNKFLDYHRHTDDNQLSFLGSAYSKDMTDDEKYWLCFLYSATYCVPTTIILFEMLFRWYKGIWDYVGKEQLSNTVNGFWIAFKPKLLFQSDRVYVKNMDWFPKMLVAFSQLTSHKPAEYFKQFIKDTPQATYDALYKEVGTWQYYGRLSIFLMLEAIRTVLKIDIDSNWLDWSDGATTTSGMMHLMYMDDEAVQFDKDHKISRETKKQFDQHLANIKGYIKDTIPGTPHNIFEVESSLCMFRKLFKQTRYGGYYLDRTQDEIEKYQHDFPNAQYLWDQLWAYRKNTINNATLGELNNRHGIQNSKLTDWVTKGEHGFENIG